MFVNNKGNSVDFKSQIVFLQLIQSQPQLRTASAESQEDPQITIASLLIVLLKCCLSILGQGNHGFCPSIFTDIVFL